MRNHTEKRQLNNDGFSLIELLIAIVILSIIVVPLLHSFVTSARTNAKSRNTMHATAIAEDVMEQFEAHTLEEMADIYTADHPTGFTNTVLQDAELDVDGDGSTEPGIWQYTFRDEKTTSGVYDVVVTLDPNGYPELNEKDIVNIQNLCTRKRKTQRRRPMVILKLIPAAEISWRLPEILRKPLKFP